MRLLPCGDRAILVEVADAAERRRLDATLGRIPLPRLAEHVPGARTVLVVARTPGDPPGIAAALRDLVLDAPEAPDESAGLVVEVQYDGPDLKDVGTHLGVAPAEVVARHTGQLWTVEFVGFAPGFGYLTGSEGDFEVPRRNSPRTRIPAGSVGLAGPYSGVYPRPSTGGWQLIGRSDLRLWDADRDPPAPGRTTARPCRRRRRPRAAQRGRRPRVGPGAALGTTAGLPRRPPTTGGYPVIAVVVDDDIDVLAQLRPGERVRFRRIPRGW